MIVIIDDLYKSRPIRIYTDYAPALRSERAGLKVIKGELDVKELRTCLLKNCATEMTKLTNIANTLLARDYKGFGNQEMNAVIEEEYKTMERVRKLTPKECWRLMGFDDEAFEKAAEVNSNSQLYKQAGNSIVVNVLEQIIGKLGERYEEFKSE